MKVGSLFAEIGFKVDESGLDKFSNALKAFQKTVKNGLKDLKEYAKAAREISQAMRDAYVPTRTEASSRYRAETANLRGSARANNAWAKRMRAEAFAGAADSYLKAQRARFFEQDSNTRATNATARMWALSQKERGLTGKHTGKYSSGILTILKNLAAFNVGGIAGGIASLAGISHPIVMAISVGVKAILGALDLLMKTVRDGVRTAMAYRDYMAFTGRSTHGISGLMAAALNTTNLTPEDIMKDVAGFEKQYWDMFFGGGNPRFFQMMGILPTGNGETDLKNILAAVYGYSDGFRNRGLARSFLGQAGLSEEYITLIEDLMRENPGATVKELFERTREQISALEDGNKTLREYDRAWKELRVELAKLFIDAGLADTLKELVSLLREIIMWIKGIGKRTPEDIAMGAGKNMLKFMSWLPINKLPFEIPGLSKNELIDMAFGAAGYGSGQSNTINSTVNNQVTVASPEEAAEYTAQSQFKGISDAWWGRYNSADRTAASVGG